MNDPRQVAYTDALNMRHNSILPYALKFRQGKPLTLADVQGARDIQRQFLQDAPPEFYDRPKFLRENIAAGYFTPEDTQIQYQDPNAKTLGGFLSNLGHGLEGIVTGPVGMFTEVGNSLGNGLTSLVAQHEGQYDLANQLTAQGEVDNDQIRTGLKSTATVPLGYAGNIGQALGNGLASVWAKAQGQDDLAQALDEAADNADDKTREAIYHDPVGFASTFLPSLTEARGAALADIEGGLAAASARHDAATMAALQRRQAMIKNTSPDLMAKRLVQNVAARIKVKAAGLRPGHGLIPPSGTAPIPISNNPLSASDTPLPPNISAPLGAPEGTIIQEEPTYVRSTTTRTTESGPGGMGGVAVGPARAPGRVPAHTGGTGSGGTGMGQVGGNVPPDSSQPSGNPGDIQGDAGEAAPTQIPIIPSQPPTASHTITQEGYQAAYYPRTEDGVPPAVFLNDRAYRDVFESVHQKEINPENGGITLYAHNINSLQAALDLERETEFVPKERLDARQNVIDVLKEGLKANHGRGVGIVRIEPETTEQYIREARSHEYVHVMQEKWRLSDEDISGLDQRVKSNIFRGALSKASQKLDALGYGEDLPEGADQPEETKKRQLTPEEVWTEIPAWITAGHYKILGLTHEEAAGLLREYAEQLDRTYGGQAVQEMFNHGSDIARGVAAEYPPTASDSPPSPHRDDSDQYAPKELRKPNAPRSDSSRTPNLISLAHRPATALDLLSRSSAGVFCREAMAWVSGTACAAHPTEDNVATNARHFGTSQSRGTSKTECSAASE